MPGLFLGFKVETFELFPLGFAVSFKIDTKNYNKKILKANMLAIKKIIVAIAGPSVNIIIIIILVLLNKEKIFNISTESIIYSNFLIFIFNMIPIYPLDGGRIIKNLTYIFFGKINSLKFTNLISKISALVFTIVSIILMFISHNVIYIFSLIYIWMLVYKESRILELKIKMYKILKNYLAINQD